jgi:hypothetical protein
MTEYVMVSPMNIWEYLVAENVLLVTSQFVLEVGGTHREEQSPADKIE